MRQGKRDFSTVTAGKEGAGGQGGKVTEVGAARRWVGGKVRQQDTNDLKASVIPDEHC